MTETKKNNDTSQHIPESKGLKPIVDSRATLNVTNLHLNIAKGAKVQPILRGVNLNISKGQIHGLVGESGAGKSMVAKTILGLLPKHFVITEGSVGFNNQDLTRLSSIERRKFLGRDIALIPQDPMTALNPVRRIGAQMADMLKLHLKQNIKEARASSLKLLEDVHIRNPERVMRSYPHELSGGMRQRVLISMAFSCKPSLIIADEPTTALDVTVQKEVLKLLRELQAQQHTSILFVSHDLGVVAKLCDVVSVIHGGRILEHAVTKDLTNKPQHPYTKALFAASPRHDKPDESLQPIDSSLIARLEQEALTYDQTHLKEHHVKEHHA